MQWDAQQTAWKHTNEVDLLVAALRELAPDIHAGRAIRVIESPSQKRTAASLAGALAASTKSLQGAVSLMAQGLHSEMPCASTLCHHRRARLNLGPTAPLWDAFWANIGLIIARPTRSNRCCVALAKASARMWKTSKGMCGPIR